jgi:hypothetical protein
MRPSGLPIWSLRWHVQRAMNDDVQNVHANFEIDEAVMEQMA